jgi:YD repeat-containing protein
MRPNATEFVHNARAAILRMGLIAATSVLCTGYPRLAAAVDCHYTTFVSKPVPGLLCSPAPGAPFQEGVGYFGITYNCDNSISSISPSPCASSKQGCLLPEEDLAALCQETDGCADPACNICSGATETCDGFDNNCDGLNDESCMGVCGEEDPYPTNLATGIAHSIERSDYALPSFDGLSFGFARVWTSSRAEVGPWPSSTVPGPSQQRAVSATFIGQGWRHDYEQRVYLWKSSNLTQDQDRLAWIQGADNVEFQRDSTQPTVGDGRSYTRFVPFHGEPWEARVYGGAGTATAIRIIDTHRYITFEFDYLTAFGATPSTAHLSRIAHYSAASSFPSLLPTTPPSLPTTLYWIQVDRNPDGSASQVKDSFGTRFLRFSYQQANIAAGTRTRVSRIQLCRVSAPAACTFGDPLIAFNYYGVKSSSLGGTGERAGGYDLLESINYDDASWERYRYTATSAGWRLTEVLRPINWSVPQPNPGDAPTAGEARIEQMIYYPDGKVQQSSGPDGSFGYSYDTGTHITRQFDLTTSPLGTCPSSCSTGYECFTPTSTCARVTTIDNTQSTGRTGGRDSYCTDCGVLSQYERKYVASDPTRLERTTDSGGMKTTYEYWAGAGANNGRLKRVVENDNDDIAGNGTGNTPSRVHDYSYGTPGVAHVDTQSFPSRLPTGTSPNVIVSSSFDAMGRVTARSMTGNTTQIGSGSSTSTVSMTSTITSQPDAFGRPQFIDGPLANSASSSDLVTFAYYTSPGTLDYGLLASVTKSVTSTSSLTKTFADYDIYGNPQTVTDYDGVVHHFTYDKIGRVNAQLMGTDATGTQWEYEPTGLLLKKTDADGTCVSYAYNTDGQVTTKWRGSATAPECGAPTLSAASGETQNFTYTLKHLTSMTAVDTSHATKFSQSYEYEERHVLSAQQRGATNSKHRYGYDIDMLQVYDKLENCDSDPANCTRINFTYDALGQPQTQERQVSASIWAKTGFDYDSSMAILPTSITTKDTANNIATTTLYSYDDFGHVVRHTSPDSGITLTEYDASGRPVKQRHGAGSLVDEDTIVTTYDGLGRVRTVDRDAGQSNACTGALGGEPLYDEEYWYDTCSPGLPSGEACANPLGHMTMARVHVSCSGSVNNPIYKRATWYTYDNRGRLAGEATSRGNGLIGFCTASSCPADPSPPVSSRIAYSYTTGGKLLTESNPGNLNYGQKYSYVSIGNGVGRLFGVTYTNLSAAATSIAYLPFGPLFRYSTGASSTSTLWHQAEYNLRYELTRTRTTLNDLATTWSNAPDMSYTRDSTGRIVSRLQATSIGLTSRFFEYDRLGRLTCEKTSGVSPGTCPVAGDASLRDSLQFSNGALQASRRPGPDNISVIAWKNAAQTSPLYQTLYDDHTNRLRQLAVTIGSGPHLDYSYDDQGRVLSDDDSAYSAPADDKRSYGYLPNGLVGTVSGHHVSQSSSGGVFTHYSDPYTMAFKYDELGRPWEVTYIQTGHIAISSYYRLYWDFLGRLIQVVYYPDFNSGSIYQRWSFAYVQSERVSAILESVSGATTSTFKLWYANDALGISLATIDGSTSGGAVVVQKQEVEAFGWRTETLKWLSGPAGAPKMMFALPGQLVFEETAVDDYQTSCFSGTGSCALLFIRPPLALHGIRLYDPLVARFGQTDPVEQVSVVGPPRQYTYAHNEPTRLIDPCGLWTFMPDSDPDFSCSLAQKIRINTAVLLGVQRIANCNRPCVDDLFRKLWANRALNAEYGCSHLKAGPHGENSLLEVGDGVCGGEVDSIPNQLLDSWTSAGSIVAGLWPTTPIILLSKQMIRGKGCSGELAEVITHESAHALGMTHDLVDLTEYYYGKDSKEFQMAQSQDWVRGCSLECSGF